MKLLGTNNAGEVNFCKKNENLFIFYLLFFPFCHALCHFESFLPFESFFSIFRTKNSYFLVVLVILNNWPKNWRIGVEIKKNWAEKWGENKHFWPKYLLLIKTLSPNFSLDGSVKRVRKIAIYSKRSKPRSKPRIRQNLVLKHIH